MRRAAVNVLTGLSVLAAVAIAALWLRARTRSDVFLVRAGVGRCAAVGTHPGGLHLSWAPASMGAESQTTTDEPGIRVLRRPPFLAAWLTAADGNFGGAFVWDVPFELCAGPDRLRAGFGYGDERWQTDERAFGLRWPLDPSKPFALDPYHFSWVVHRFAVPFWFLLAASAALPAFRVARRVLRRSPPASCRRCGYDLRATPDRCPECGAAPAVVAGRSAAPI